MPRDLDPASSADCLRSAEPSLPSASRTSVLIRVLNEARELTGARYAAMGILDDDKTGLARFLTVGIDDEMRQRIGPLPQGHGILGELIRNPAPLRLARISEHPRSYGFPADHPPMETFLGVPVRIRDEVYGNLYLTEKAGGAEFDETDERAPGHPGRMGRGRRRQCSRARAEPARQAPDRGRASRARGNGCPQP